MAIPNMDDLTPIAIAELEIVPYTANVQIFKSTPALEIPNKLNAVAVDFKEWNNTELGTKGVGYLNSGIVDTVDYLNSSMRTITNYINSVVVANQNTFTSEMKTSQNILMSKMETSTRVGYSISQVNSLEFSGNSTIEYDENKNITKVVQGAKETSSIAYNSENKIISFTEKITVDSSLYTKNYTVEYDLINGNPIISEVA